MTSALLRRISADGPGVGPGELAALRVPTLVLGTARDLVHPLAHVRRAGGGHPGRARVEITAKAESRDRYREEFRAALAPFLEELAP